MIPSRAPTTRALRASDDERERVASVLQAHAADGRLSLDELSERLGTCYAARTQAELQSLLWDLPGEAPAPVASRPPKGRARTLLVALGLIVAFAVVPQILAVGFGLVMAAGVLVVLALALLVPVIIVVASIYAGVRMALSRGAPRRL